MSSTRHPYLNKEAGWETIAGQDVSASKYKVIKYLLVVNYKLEDKTKRSAILSAQPATVKSIPDWQLVTEGSLKAVQDQFDNLSNGFHS